MCVPTTPTRQSTNTSHTPRNRNQLCFDLGDDADIESPRKRTKLNPHAKSPKASSLNEVNTTTEKIRTESIVTALSNSNIVNDIDLADAKSSDADLMIVEDELPVRSTEALSNGYSTVIPSDNPITDNETEQEMGECPICFLQIPVKVLITHASNCEGRMEHDGADDKADFPEMSFKDTGTKTESVLCPICQKLFPKDRIDVHVNVCLDTSI